MGENRQSRSAVQCRYSLKYIKINRTITIYKKKNKTNNYWTVVYLYLNCLSDTPCEDKCIPI